MWADDNRNVTFPAYAVKLLLVVLGPISGRVTYMCAATCHKVVEPTLTLPFASGICLRSFCQDEVVTLSSVVLQEQRCCK